MKSYNAIFNYADDGVNVSFPDLEGCFTSSGTREDAYKNALDALPLWLAHAEKKFINPPSTHDDLKKRFPDDEIVEIPVKDNKKMSEQETCVKCGSDDLLTRYRSRGELINSSSTEKVDNEFIQSSEYDYFYKLTASKDHLHIHCRNCQYSWDTDTKEARI